MDSFRAFRVHSGEDRKTRAQLDTITLDDLSEGNVVVRVGWSDVNYKDALAATGTSRIMRRLPMVAGIDLAGVVETSDDEAFPAGSAVAVVGAGLSEDHDGGYTEYARVRSDQLVRLPDHVSGRDAMAIGTAGFTAALALLRMEENHQTPADGPVLVNGATGGVGSIAIDIFSARGYEVVALTGKAESSDYLRSLGASQVLVRGELEMGARPLERGSYAGGVDNLGGDVLSWMLRSTKPGGNVAAIGLAASTELNTSVMPFIIRGVNLLGINSVIMPSVRRQAVWDRIGTDFMPRHLDKIISQEVALADLQGVFDAYIDGTMTGRTVVRIGGG
ncbi:MAG: acryloyl-CoA reductase [Gammaproteobacteria bacterium]|nr:acryloyl-CoA reductase [Gammaproteobacteria bacterium]